ncbi:MAG: NAD-dependent protein deacylase, partial [Clostridia bacterium]|nr:NAD-dependent protein deacylase [Clostridia bacterium]
IARADLLMIGGTSLTVYPAASFIRYFRGKKRIIINRDFLNFEINPHSDLMIRESIGQVLAPWA